MDDAVGTLSMIAYPTQIVPQVATYVIHKPALLVAQRHAPVFEDFRQLSDKLLGDLGEVVDEVQRVPYLVGHTCRQLTQSSQLLTHYNLALGPMQVLQDNLKLLILALQLIRQLLH